MRSVAEQDREIGEVEGQQHHGIDPAELLLPENNAEVQERRHQSDDLHRVLALQPNNGK
jgi:hypothetical protein